MNIFHSIADFRSNKKTILTLGTFDGVHVGHKKILERIKSNSENKEYESLLLTFFPHPRMVLKNKTEIKLLNSISEKIKLLEELGIDNLVIHPFDEVFSKLTAEEFVKTILVDTFHIHKIIIGYDHRFGVNRTANIDDLVNFGKQFNFEVEQILAQEVNSISVSSTKIRQALLKGEMNLAKEYLGYDYFFTALVIKGKQLGRTIGFPTANLKIEEEHKLVPLHGVYLVKSSIHQETVYGIMNIGFNPTVAGKMESIEVHYLNFNANLYDQVLTITVLKYLRAEQKFDSLVRLTAQLEKDRTTAIAILKNNGLYNKL